MLCSAVSLALTWLLALCLAFPQLPSNNDESIHEKWASSTHNKKLQPDGDDGASYPETIVYRRSEASVEGPPADKMEIAGFQMFLGDKPEGMQVFAIVNEYKGQQLIRQNACLKSLVQETTSPSPVRLFFLTLPCRLDCSEQTEIITSLQLPKLTLNQGGCYDMSDYQPVVGDRGVLSQEQYTTVFNNLMAIRHDSLRTTIAINAAYNKNQHLWIQFGHQSYVSPLDFPAYL